MDLIIFNPPRYSNGSHHKFNNALLWLASYLYRRNIEVRIVPLNNEKYEETVQREIEKYKPGYAAISCKWWDTLYAATYIASLIKKCDPSITIITGGHTATFFASDIVNNTDFDVVIRGDGEEPLYRLVTGQEPLNCVFKGNQSETPFRNQYIQTVDNFKDIYLIENLEDVISDVSVFTSYIWTGKGCNETCVYCAGNAWNNMQSFGRSSFIYRPIESAIKDIKIMQKYSDVARILLDFDPLRGDVQETYHIDLLASLEKKKYNCYFCSWSLPSKDLIDALAETFNFIELSIDIQTPSEHLRKQLGDRHYLKASFSDNALEDVLNHCSNYENFIIDLSSLMGLPFEQSEDVEIIKTFSDYFYDKFENLRYPYVSPMNVEPGSLLMKDPERYGMVLLRKTFDDFLQYTRKSFENNTNCYQPKSYGEGIFHPLGVVSKEDYENGDIFRVYETWKQIQEHIDRRSNEKMLLRAMKFKKYGLSKVGLVGGVDRPSLEKLEVE